MSDTFAIDRRLDKHLHVLKSQEGDLSSLSLSTEGNGIKVSGDLEVTGNVESSTIYPGQILGYTVIGLDESPSQYDVLASMNPVHDNLKVSFITPPSGNVEIFASIYVDTDSTRPLTFGLSTANETDGFVSLGAKYENHTWYGDETDGQQHSHRWYLSGLTPSSNYTLWFAAGCTATSRIDLRWGGDSSAVADGSEPYEYQPFVMKATALPKGVYTG